MRRLISAALLSACFFLPDAHAGETTISAQYRGGATFINTTPPASFCQLWPEWCSSNQVETVGLPMTYGKRTTKQAEDVRDRFYIHLPGQRPVTVTNDQTGESHQLSFEIVNVSQYVVTSDGGGVPVWTQSVGGGCRYLRSLSPGGKGWAYYLWEVRSPTSPAACYSSGDMDSAGQVRDNQVSDLGIGYRLRTPSPLKMKQGTYRGQLTYLVGPGADFDFGNDVTGLSSQTLTINFELDVVHAFVIDFPAGSERVVLEPPGGWTQWLNNKRLPERLYRDLPMRMWSSGPFTVHSRCEYPLGNQCAIRNNANDHQVPVQVALTLPNVILHNGQQVTRLPLPVGEGSAIELEATQPAINRAGSLHFQVDKAAVSEMTRYPGARYEGDITVIFDADF